MVIMSFRYISLVLLLTLGVAAVGVIAPPEPAGAQGLGRFVDLSVELDVLDDTSSTRTRLYLVASNLGNQTAYDVDVEAQQIFGPSGWSLKVLPVGTANFPVNDNITRDTFEWHIPKIPPRTHYVAHFGGLSTSTNLRDSVSGYVATVTSGAYESADRLHNNSDRAWEVFDYLNEGWAADPDYSVKVSVENPSASSADFTVTVVLPSSRGGSSTIYKGCVNVRLTPGLTAGSATLDPPNDPSLHQSKQRSFDISGGKECGGSSDATGVFVLPRDHAELMASVQLPVTVNSGANLSEQCLTAEIFATPPTGPQRFDDNPADNLARACLGSAPVQEGDQVALRDGTVDLFTWYDCVGRSARPCNHKDDGDATTNDDLQLVGVAEDGRIFQPNQVTVHVPDPAGRTVDTSDGLVWSTGFETFGDCHVDAAKCLPGGIDRPGVVIARNTALLDLESTIDDDRWGTPHSNPSFTAYETGYVKASASAPASGKMTIYRKRNSDQSRFLLWSTVANGVDYEASAEILARTTELGYSSADNGPMYAEFTQLGTYEMTLKIAADYETNVNDTQGENNPTPPTNHEDEETYIFHVGPMADLSVADGSSSDATDTQTAYTILAANNGPEHSADARVEITLPSGAQVTEYVASEGTYSNGVWTLPGLKLPGLPALPGQTGGSHADPSS